MGLSYIILSISHHGAAHVIMCMYPSGLNYVNAYNSAQEHGKSDILKAEAQHIRDVCVTMPCPMNWENIQNWAIFIGSLVAVFLVRARTFRLLLGASVFAVRRRETYKSCPC